MASGMREKVEQNEWGWAGLKAGLAHGGAASKMGQSIVEYETEAISTRCGPSC